MVYSRQMFPGIEPQIKKNLQRVGRVNRLGRRYLPIGSAMLTLADSSANCYLISAPTMLLPQNVSSTNNAFWAFLAALKIVHAANRQMDAKIETIVCPALCCGWGKMRFLDSARQIKAALDVDAHRTHKCKLLPVEGGVAVVEDDKDILAEQPKLYENSEFFAIDPCDIVR